jgi:hypothetical protein
LAEEKGAVIWKAFGMMNKGCVLAPSGKASEEMSNPYIRMYEQITGTKFIKGAVPIIQRLEKNLKKY